MIMMMMKKVIFSRNFVMFLFTTTTRNDLTHVRSEHAMIH